MNLLILVKGDFLKFSFFVCYKFILLLFFSGKILPLDIYCFVNYVSETHDYILLFIFGEYTPIISSFFQECFCFFFPVF